jgi:hypothetical protein
VTLRLWLASERERIRKATKDQQNPQGVDTYDCSVCRRHPVKQRRFCWLDHRRRTAWVTIKSGEIETEVSLTRKDLMTLPILSQLEPLEDLARAGKPGVVSVGGKPICPAPLSHHPEADDALNIEADMTGGEGGWTLHPLPGPSCDWPRDFLAILRHIRAVKGMIQAREMREMDSSTVSPAPQNG